MIYNKLKAQIYWAFAIWHINGYLSVMRDAKLELLFRRLFTWDANIQFSVSSYFTIDWFLCGITCYIFHHIGWQWLHSSVCCNILYMYCIQKCFVSVTFSWIPNINAIAHTSVLSDHVFKVSMKWIFNLSFFFYSECISYCEWAIIAYISTNLNTADLAWVEPNSSKADY